MVRGEAVRSLKDQMLSMPRGRPVPVDMRSFPEWPQSLFMKPPSGAEIAKWEQSGIEYGKKGKISVKQSPTRKAELIQITLCNEAGELIFAKKDEINDIAKLDAGVVNHLFAAARKVAGQDVGDDDDDEDAEGN